MSRAPSGKRSKQFANPSGARGRPSGGVEKLEERHLFAVSVTPYAGGANATSLVQNNLLVGNTGITIVSATYVGTTSQGGTYTGFDYPAPSGGLTIGDGVILTSGLAAGAEGPNQNFGVFDPTSGGIENETNALGTAGDANL